MKAVEKTIEVPADSRVEVFYTCEEPECDFETEDEEWARKHHGQQHAVKGERKVEGLLFLLFDSEADFTAFVEANTGEERDEVDGDWSGPGWYGKEYGSKQRGCGCCSNTTLKLVAAEDMCATWRDRALHLNRVADLLEDLVEECR